jgi:DNA-binding transcriptional LysR family regulator
MSNLRRTVGNADALLVFESAARLGSFTRAAEELGISQPAVTRHVRTVEGAVGRPLFRRDHNRLSLTDAGRRLWSSLAAGFGEIAGTLETLRAEAGGTRLVFAAHAGFAQQWLMPRFSELCALLGGSDVRLMISDSTAELDRGGFDFAVRVGRGDWRDQGSHRLVTERVRPVAAPRLLQARPWLAEAAPADLLAAPLLHMDAGDKPWTTWRGWFRAVGVDAPPPAPGVLYNNYPLVLQEVLAGNGVALGWRPLTDRPLAQGALVPLGPEVETPELGYFLTWPRDDTDPELRARLCAWFDRQFDA